MSDLNRNPKTDIPDNKKEYSAIKIFLISIRPFALPASVIPVIFGTLLAVIIGDAHFKILNFLLALSGMVFLHSGANVLSDINDYKMGIDRIPTPASGGIVRGLITTGNAFWISLFLLASGTVCGIILVFLSGIFLLYIGIAGLLIGIFYNLRPFTLKYRALGDLAVFINFGTLGTLGAWFTQIGKPSLIPVIWSVPISMLVVAILHANNWRDIETDRNSKIRTIADLLGNKGSYIYYASLIFGAIIFITLYVLISNYIFDFQYSMPLSFLIVLFTIPMGIKLNRIARKGLEDKAFIDFVMLDAKTSNMSLMFGILCNIALLINFILKNLV